MKEKLIKFLVDVLTARNGADYSLTKIMGISAGITMIVKFWSMTTPDFSGFGMGIAGIMAALAAKYYAEGEKK